RTPAPSGYGAPAPTGYAAPPGAYAGPAAGYAAPFAPEPERPATSTTGVLSLVLALIAVVLGTALGSWAAFEIGRGVVSMDNLTSSTTNPLRLLTPVRDVVLWAEITFWAATALGVVAFVLGIVATVKRRGRGAGIAGLVIAAVGPFVFAGVAWALFTAGAAAGINALS
ncbi:hypothetical protein, partial [Microbacterium resistens]